MTLGIIPARYASTRFPGKPLAMVRGKSMIQRVYEQAAKSDQLSQVIVATDDERIAGHLDQHSIPFVMTRSDHPSGTDRCAEVAAGFPQADYVVNIQGDEPFIQPEQIDLLVQALKSDQTFSIGTLAKPIKEEAQLNNPNIVKVVCSRRAGALYFSRHPVPFLRNTDETEGMKMGLFLKHIGMYAFTRETLMQIASLAPAPLEKAESLEQLRWLENGYRILVATTLLETIGVDTPEDLDRINNGEA